MMVSEARFANRYRIERILGQGGMGTVYLAMDLERAEPVALKVLRPQFLEREGAIERFMREARTASAVRHPSIVHVHDVGRFEGLPWMAMEVLHGENLRERLKRLGPRPVAEILPIFVPLLDALHELHAVGIAHRDLKPANLFLSIDDSGGLRPKLLDFGIAKNMQGASRLTQTGQVVGTACYLAPEQAWDTGYVDVSTDIYAVGVVLFETLSGMRPNAVSSSHQLVAKLILRKEPRQLLDCAPHLPSSLAAIVQRCLAFEPAGRPKTARALARLLQRNLADVASFFDLRDYDDNAETSEYVPLTSEEFAVHMTSMATNAHSNVTRVAEVEYDDRLDSVMPTAGAIPDALPRARDSSLPTREEWIAVQATSGSPEAEQRASENVATSTPSVSLGTGGMALVNSHVQLGEGTFFGRESEMSQLTDLIRQGHRLITLHGGGGVGKTRFAHEFALRSQDAFMGGACFVDLTEARTPAEMKAVLAASLGVTLTEDDTDASISNAMRAHGHRLWILDNFEQVASHAQATVEAWHREVTEAVFLVTSRARLNLVAEVVVELNDLDMDAATALFFERGHQADPAFARTETNVGPVHQIVARLEGIPLAIELAASRIRGLTPARMLTRLSERFRLLSSHQQGAERRPVTLRATLDWSWDLLTEDVQLLLAQLGAFHRGASWEAIEVVLVRPASMTDPMLRDALQALADESWLRMEADEDGAVRYRILETVREYLVEKLGDERPAVELRHAQHYARFGEDAALDRLDQHGGLAQLARLGREMDNLRAAIEVAVDQKAWALAVRCSLALAAYWERKGPFREGVDWMRKLAPFPFSEQLSARVAAQEGRLLQLVGDSDQAQRCTQRAVTLFAKLGDARREGMALSDLGFLLQKQGQVSEAKDCYENALLRLMDVRDQRNEGAALRNLAYFFHGQGQMDEARRCLQRALVLLQASGDSRLEASVLSNLGNMSQASGHFDEAFDMYTQAVSTFRLVGDRRMEGVVLGNLAHLHHASGAREKALDLLREALLIAREVGDRRHEGLFLGNLGDFLLQYGEDKKAEEHLRAGIARCEAPWPVAAAVFRGSLGLLLARRAQWRPARVQFQTAEAHLRGVDAAELAILLTKLARAEHLAGAFDKARNALQEAEAIAQQLEADRASTLAQVLETLRAELASQGLED